MSKIADLLDSSDFSSPSTALGVLGKKESREPILRQLFQQHGDSLIQNVRLEGCSRRTEFDEDQFVRFYPYLPHLLDLSADILAGIRAHPDARRQFGGDEAIAQQVLDMLVSDRTRLAEQTVGALVSIDRIYELVEGKIAPNKRNDVREISERFEWDEDYPRMAGRVAKAICLMEFVKTDLPRSTRNIASLLVQGVNEARPTLAVAAILYHLKDAGMVREIDDGWRLSDYDELRRMAADMERLRNAVGAINPRPSGWHNHLLQIAKKTVARMLVWYTRPSREFNNSVSRSIEELVSALDRLSTNIADQSSRSAMAIEELSVNIRALEGRMGRLEKRNTSPIASNGRVDKGAVSHGTTYIIGLFGTGRRYINELLLKNLGERARYFRDTIRLHPGPTPMIYSGHATMKYASRGQESPEVMNSILGGVRSGFADWVFIYRHPLDSLLTNWAWWRANLHDNRSISGISEVYTNLDDLCAALEENFCEFLALTEGRLDFFGAAPGPRFLSFAEYVEETELHLQSAPLALRLEDFVADPRKEFSKIAAFLSLDTTGNQMQIAPPRTKPFGYLAVREMVPRFRNFMNRIDAETIGRIERIGYPVS